VPRRVRRRGLPEAPPRHVRDRPDRPRSPGLRLPRIGQEQHARRGRRALSGQPHDGRAGTEEGFGYRIVYVEPSRLTEALRVLRGRPYPLPFLREPVSRNARLARAIGEAFRAPPDSLAIDSLVVGLAEGLMAGE